MKQQQQQHELRVRQLQEMSSDVAMADESSHNNGRDARNGKEDVDVEDLDREEEDARNSSAGSNEPEIDVTNVSNSNCDLIRHNGNGVVEESNAGAGTAPTDLRLKYE